jgi:hypothetical protein
MTEHYIRVRASKYKNLAGDLVDNLSGLNPVFYGLGPGGERRCLEEETLYSYEPGHDYRSGRIVTKDGTRMATTQANALEAGWADVANMMAERSIK